MKMVIKMPNTIGGTESRLTIRGCQLRQPYNLCVMLGQMMSTKNTIANMEKKAI